MDGILNTIFDESKAVLRDIHSYPAKMKRRTMREEQRGSPDSGSRVRAGSLKNPESKMSEALFNLSVKDRNAIEEEVHGVSCMAPDETPEFLDDALEKFHLELFRIDRKPAYDRAQELLEESPPGQPRSYIHARGYKLRFLRCELFDARKAAKRYIKYLDFIFELHGDIALKRPIRMTDLNRVEMSFLRKGINQVLPVRDRSGRRIMCVVPNSRDDTPKEVLVSPYNNDSAYPKLLNVVYLRIHLFLYVLFF